MPAVYKLITGIIALVGNLSVITTGELNPLFIIISIFMFIGYWRAIKGQKQAHKIVIGGISIFVLLIFLFDAFLLSTDIILSVSHLSLMFHTLKSFDLKDPWDSLQVFFMSLIQLLLASELTRSIVFGAVFLLFMIAMIFAISYSHFIKEGITDIKGFIRPIVMITLIIIFMTTITFIFLPRLRGGLWGKGLSKGIKSGFSDTVKLGSLENIKLDPTVVMRISVKPHLNVIPYWRGITFELYSNNTWIDIDTNKIKKIYSNEGNFIFKNNYTSNDIIKQEIILEPIDSDIIFALRDPVKLIAKISDIELTNDGAIYVPRKSLKRFHYIVFSTEKPIVVSNVDIYLKLPKRLKRLKQFAKEVTKGKIDSYEKAKTIEKYLRENYSYSLKIKHINKNIDPIEDFLFNVKKGYCEYYATAMVLMLRSIGIPARVVSGYIGGEYNKYGDYYIVRQSNAHTWVEAAIKGKWITFDPTPPEQTKPQSIPLLFIDYIKLKWERYVVGFSSIDQIRLLKFFFSPFKKLKYKEFKPQYILYPLIITFIIIISLVISRILKFKNNISLISKKYQRIKKHLNKDNSLTATEILNNLPEHYQYKKEEIKEFFILYSSLRFGMKQNKEEIIRYNQLYKKLKKL